MKRSILVLIVAAAALLTPSLARAQTYYPFGSVNVGVASSNVRVGPVGCYVNTTDPTYTNAQIHPLSCTTTGALRILGQVSLANGGVVSVSDITGTITLPTGAATSAKQPALGTAGTPSADYLSVQGSPTMTPFEMYITDPAGNALPLAADVTEDSPETPNVGGPMVLGVRRDTAASSAGASGDNATFNTDELGLLWTRTIDPCGARAKTYIPINISTATTTEITPSLAGASNHYYVCSINIGPTAGAQNIALVDDDTDNCASVTSGVAGGTTAGSGWNAAANGGIAFGNGLGAIARTNGTNRVLCLVTSAATQTSGVITVVAAP